MEFANKEYLFLLLLIIPYIIWYVMYRKKSEPTIRMADTHAFRFAPRSWRVTLMPLQLLLRLAVFVLLILVLARPQTSNSWKNETMEGIDIMLAMDVSTSMLAEDLKPNRIEAAKQVASDFIIGRPSDNIGLTIFAGEAFTQVPLTIDHNVLLKQLSGLKDGMTKDGTALGDGLATAINRIKDSEAKSKVIILLTDGINNQGAVDPQSAAEIAALYNIRLYTIGVGTKGLAPYPFRDAFGRKRYQNVPVELDENLLTQMAQSTNDGQYFRATNKKSLQQIFNQIDKMEKSKIDVTQYSQTKDEYQGWLILAALALLLEILLGLFYFRSTP
jgi:Ca-activated chloride channel family protein